jgi:hypothetical protein
MAAELIGDLLRMDGYIQVQSLYDESLIIPVWPTEITVTSMDDPYVILDGDGKQIARIGEEIYMGRGEGYGR